MAETSQVSVNTSSWTQISGVTAGVTFLIQAKYSFYYVYSDSTPSESGAVDSYLVEDSLDNSTKYSRLSEAALGNLWVKSKDQNQTLIVTTGIDLPASGSGTLSNIEVLIEAGQNTSSAIDLGGKQIVAVTFPAAFTGSTIRFDNAFSLAGTYREVNQVDSASTYVVPVALNDQQPVDLWVSWGLSFVKLVSSATESSDRTLYLVVR